MTFLSKDIDNELSCRFQQIYSDEGYFQLNAEGGWDKLEPGSGGGGDLPSWVKNSSAEIGSTETKKAILNAEFLDIMNNVDQTASSLSSSHLVLGDVDGNSILNRETIDAANRVKDIVMEEAPTARKMLLYDTTTKALTYADQPTDAVLPEYLKPDSVEIDSGTGSTTKHLGNSVVIEPTNTAVSGLVSHLSSANLTVGSTIAGYPGSVSSNQPRGIVSPTYIRSHNNASTYCELNSSGLSITNGIGSPAVLNKARLNDLVVLNQKTSVTTPTATQKMLLFDTSNSTYRYTDTPPVVTLPSYLEPNQIEMSDGATKTNIMKPSEIEVKDTLGGFGIGKAVLTYNNLKIGTQGPVYDNTFDETRPLIHIGSEQIRTQNNNATKAASLTPNYFSITDSGVTHLLTHSRVGNLMAFGDKTSVATPVTTQKMLLWDTADSSYKYTDIPPTSTFRTRSWNPSALSVARWPNNGLVNGAVSYNFDGMILTTTANFVTTLSNPSTIGTSGDYLNDNDILFANLMEHQVSFATDKRIAVFPIKFYNGDYSGLPGHMPLISVLGDMRGYVKIRIAGGQYTTDSAGTPVTNYCHLVICEYTGPGPYNWTPTFALKVEKLAPVYTDTI